MIRVNWGSMFSGKSEELLKRMRRASIGGKTIRLYKPRLDDRYSVDEVVTHYGASYPCKVLGDLSELLTEDLSGVDVIGIDEGQFFGDNLVEVCVALKKRGFEVIVSGLDMWSSGEPVMNMAMLAAISNTAKKFHAVCVKTGQDAYISHCLAAKDGDVLVGGADSYIAVCEEAHEALLLEEREVAG